MIGASPKLISDGTHPVVALILVAVNVLRETFLSALIFCIRRLSWYTKD